jgi:hypothetical protein
MISWVAPGDHHPSEARLGSLDLRQSPAFLLMARCLHRLPVQQFPQLLQAQISSTADERYALAG